MISYESYLHLRAFVNRTSVAITNVLKINSNMRSYLTIIREFPSRRDLSYGRLLVPLGELFLLSLFGTIECGGPFHPGWDSGGEGEPLPRQDRHRLCECADAFIPGVSSRPRTVCSLIFVETQVEGSEGCA
jgi:hypothetical protein